MDLRVMDLRVMDLALDLALDLTLDLYPDCLRLVPRPAPKNPISQIYRF